MSNVPNIRFKGFSDPWEQRKFSDLVLIERGGSPRPINDFITDAPDGVNWVKIGDAPLQGHYIMKTSEKIRPEGLSKTREVHPGDLILSNSMSFGKPYIMGIDGCIHDGWLLIRNTNNIFNLNFLCHLLGTPQMLDQYRALAAGSTVHNLNKELVGNTIVTIPNIKEQERLGQYLEKIDNLITLHQRKCDETKELKKYMLQKLFPKKGCNIPEIRFDGYTEPWEQRKLLSCIQKIIDFRGRTPKKLGMDWSESGYLALSALNVKDGYIDFSQDVHYGDQTLYNVWMCGNELHKGQVLFTTEAPMGNVAQVPDNKRYILSQRTIAFDVKENIISENFLATLLRSPEVFNTLTSLSSGGTAKGVSQKSLASVDIHIPVDLREQSLLASCFCNLNNLITLHQRKCEELKEIKKYMLSNMFPKGE